MTYMSDGIFATADLSATVDELVTIWRTVLRNDALHAYSDLLESGGTSLTAVRIVAYVREDLGREVSIAQVLDHPTPESLAAVVRAAPACDEDF